MSDDPRVWSELTGLPVTDVEVVPGGQPAEGITVDGQQLEHGDTYRLTVEGAGQQNGIYTVTGGEADE